MFREKLIKKYLEKGLKRNCAQAEIDFVCSILFNLSAVDILLEKNLPDDFECKLMKIINERLETKRPIQQIAGLAYFMNDKYIVDENVLIPRPETELLVLKAKEIIEKNNFKNFLDIGSGSGCISIELLKLCPQLIGESVDISEKTLEIARQNALKHSVNERLKLKQSDLFSNVEGKFDLIVSNPPYIPKKEKPFLQSEVRDFEPDLALFTNDDEGIEIYQKILSQAKNYLNKEGFLIFEIGYNQGKLLEQLFGENGFCGFELIKDLSGNDRVVFGRLKQSNGRRCYL